MPLTGTVRHSVPLGCAQFSDVRPATVSWRMFEELA